MNHWFCFDVAWGLIGIALMFLGRWMLEDDGWIVKPLSFKNFLLSALIGPIGLAGIVHIWNRL